MVSELEIDSPELGLSQRDTRCRSSGACPSRAEAEPYAELVEPLDSLERRVEQEAGRHGVDDRGITVQCE